MALKEPGGNLGRGTGRVHKSKGREGLRVTVLGRFQVEQLETRILLFGGPFHASTQPVSPPAAIAYIFPASRFLGQGALGFGSLNENGGSAGTTVISPEQPGITTQQWSSTVAMVRRPAPVDPSGHRAEFDGSSQASPPHSFGVAPLFVVLQGVTAPIGAGDGIVGLSRPGYDGSNLAPDSRRQSGFGMGFPSPQDFADELKVPVLPGGTRESYDGTLSAGHPWMAVEIPIGSSYESFALTVRGTGGSEATPVFGSVALVDSEGVPLDQADSGFGIPPLQALDVALRGAPAGGHLVVQIMTAETSATTEAGTTAVSSPGSSWSASFVLSVQRQDGQGQANSSTPPAQGSIVAGTLAVPASVQTGVLSTSDNPVTTGANTASGTALANEDPGATVVAAADEPASNVSDGFNLRVPTGPFVSRSAGPLGPILASVGGDPTPEVDRNERALFQEIERPDAAEDTIQDAPRYELTRTAAGENDTGAGGGPVMTVSGAGGFPLKVTGLPKNRRTDLFALLASIPAAGADDAGEQSPEPAHGIDPSQVGVIAESSAPADEPVYSDFVKAACGLALGLGMSSRALFPDLLASARKRADLVPEPGCLGRRSGRAPGSRAALPRSPRE